MSASAALLSNIKTEQFSKALTESLRVPLPSFEIPEELLRSLHLVAQDAADRLVTHDESPAQALDMAITVEQHIHIEAPKEGPTIYQVVSLVAALVTILQAAAGMDRTAEYVERVSQILRYVITLLVDTLTRMT